MEWKRGPIIGRGSYAAVYLATATTTGDLFAVKSTELSTSSSLQKEQHFLSKLTSKHIIKYMGFDVNYHNNKPTYNLFMELAAGGTISDVIKTNGGSLDETLIRSYTRQILLGLDQIHSNNFVHCDIKCGNLLVCEEGVKIGDFGCAKTAGNGEKKFSGTPVFMSPEVARGEEQGFPADIWALGCVVIEMATGSNPWPELTDPVSGLYKIGYSGESPEFPKWLPENGKDFLAKCLEIDAKKRWSTKELLQHPFVVNSDSGCETRTSPTSTLDRGFWESLSVAALSPETQMGIFSGESPAERLNRLVEVGNLGFFPNWDDEGWTMVRGDLIEEMEVDDCGFDRTDSFSFLNLNLEDEEEEEEEEQMVERLVSDEDVEVLQDVIVSRVLDFDHVINHEFLEIKESLHLLCF